MVPNEDDFKGFTAAILDHPLKFGAVVGLCRHSTVNIAIHDINAVSLGKCTALSYLTVNAFLSLII